MGRPVVGGWDLCSQLSSGKTRNVGYTGVSLQMEECVTCFQPRRLGMDVTNGLVTSALSVQTVYTGSPRLYVHLGPIYSDTLPETPIMSIDYLKPAYSVNL